MLAPLRDETLVETLLLECTGAPTERLFPTVVGELVQLRCLCTDLWASSQQVQKHAPAPSPAPRSSAIHGWLQTCLTRPPARSMWQT